MVAGKLDPTVGQLCFHRIFQTVRNLGKGTTEMSSEGQKMVGRRYGSAWNSRKTSKFGETKVAASALFAGPILASLEATGLEILPTWSSGGGAPPWPAHVQGWWPVTPPMAETRLVYKWVKTTQFGVQCFGEFSLGLWSSK